jgi:hypothetical protein
MSDTVSSMLGNAGEPITLAHAGKTYRFSLITQRVKSAWERRLRGRALEAFADLRQDDPEGYALAVQGVGRDHAAGRYAWGGDLSNQASGTEAGVLALVSLLVGVPEAEAAALATARPVDVENALEAVYVESFPHAAAAIRAALAKARERRKGQAEGDGVGADRPNG